MRLIDADKVRKQLLMMESMEDVVEIIDNEPTAYDVDKVVEELEFIQDNTFIICILAAYENAIEIVKRGGIDE